MIQVHHVKYENKINRENLVEVNQMGHVKLVHKLSQMN
jgi:hypothetical protein